jgi:hypothetical protein
MLIEVEIGQEIGCDTPSQERDRTIDTSSEGRKIEKSNRCHTVCIGARGKPVFVR